MKKNIYIMRHGQTLFNFQKKIQGYCDSPLTSLGIKQAKMAGKWFINNNITINSAYTSTSERTSDTIENALPNQTYKRIKGLKEINCGTIEGEFEKNYVYSSKPGEYYSQFGGESQLEFETRISETINEIAQTDDSKNILIVAHGGLIQTFGMLNLENSDYDQIPSVKNCSIHWYEYDTKEKNWSLKEIIEHKYENIELKK